MLAVFTNVTVDFLVTIVTFVINLPLLPWLPSLSLLIGCYCYTKAPDVCRCAEISYLVLQ
jgi:hypothetical protein